ncbi:hypothetical protein GGI19_003537 [Coemansia pectinata]|uniref:Peregrin n=1 Tax=Coemansia pectinata TaxID=1052879 RepID=A0A9W8GVE5_9FUNG|nr:hypothetical protein GGI19_003537 [Coemansia pectinata]
MVGLYFCVSILNNLALGFQISIPLHIVFRSSGLIANMMCGYFVAAKRYPAQQVVAVLMVSAGVVIATLASITNDAPADNGSVLWFGVHESVIGIALLTLGVVLAAMLGLYQEFTYRTYGKHWKEGLFYNHALALPMFLLFRGDIASQARALSMSRPVALDALPLVGACLGSCVRMAAVPALWFSLAANVMSQLVCVSGVHRMTSMSTSLSLNVVLNLRKLVSLVLSVLLFKNPVTRGMLFGCALVFLGTFAYSQVSSGQPPSEVKRTVHRHPSSRNTAPLCTTTSQCTQRRINVSSYTLTDSNYTHTHLMGLNRMGAAQTRTVSSGLLHPAEDSDASIVSRSALARSRRSIIIDEDDVEVKATDEEFVQTSSESEEDDEPLGSSQINIDQEVVARRDSGGRLRRLGSDVESSATSERISRRRSGTETSCGYTSSPTPVSRRGLRRGHADSLHRPSALRKQLGTPEHSDTEIVRPARRKLAPVLVVDADLESPLQSPAPIIDKPREERSYREFYPDLNTCLALPVVLSRESLPEDDLTPSTLNGVDRRLSEEAQPEDSLGSSPLSDISSSVATAERPLPSRTSSSLSIRLVFNDPESPARLSKPQSPRAGITVPPPLRSAGKSAHSYSGTPQSSVVVLAPKKPVLSLPEARFQPITDETLFKQTEFKRPESHYIRNIELTETDLAERVEYDLEEVDREWLRSFNHERIVTGVGGPELSANVLEELIDSIEKTWFDLVKDVQKAISAIQQDQLPPDESACAICGEEECDNTNAIVFCDGCNLAVHQDCYGVPYIPEGQWLCRKCILSPDTDVSCMLCPQRGGAFKKTTTNKWAHLLCALWIPEVGISNSAYMEPIDSLDQIPKSRWRLYCNLCHRKVGACIQCSQKQCVTAFHATCARKARLSMTVRADRRTGETIFRAFCERHTPSSHTQKIDIDAPLKGLLANRRKPGVGGGTATPLALSMVSADLNSLLASNGSNGSRLSLAAADGTSTPSNGLNTTGTSSHWPISAVNLLSHADKEIADLFRRAIDGGGLGTDNDDASLQLTMLIFNPARPVLNDYVFRQILERAHLNRMNQQQRTRVVTRVGRFWALKRSVRHGAPLLKRLYLEPWTASATKQRALEMAEAQRQAIVRRVRTDLERVRMLVESVRRRERDKLRRARVQVEYLQKVIDPVTPVMKEIIEELADKRDPRGIFSQAVSNDDAPDYDQLIKEPMDFGTVRRKIADFEYHRLSSEDVSVLDLFERDIRLVCTNCMAYNKPTTYYFQLASRVLRHVERLMAAARAQIDSLPIDPNTGCLMAGVDFDIFSLNAQQPVAPPSSADIPSSPKAADEPVETPVSDIVTPAMTRSQRKGDQPLSPPPIHPDTPPPSAVDKEDSVAEPVSKTVGKSKSKKQKAMDEKAFRRMTLFEKLSLPPPDVRKREISHFLNRHPSSANVPHSGIPDDVNVLKDRLRRTSLAVLPVAESSSPASKGRLAATLSESTLVSDATTVCVTPKKRRADDTPLTPSKRGKSKSKPPVLESSPNGKRQISPLQVESSPASKSKPATMTEPTVSDATPTTTPKKRRVDDTPSSSSKRSKSKPGLESSPSDKRQVSPSLSEPLDSNVSGLLVWVKAQQHAWFPGEIIRPNDWRVPKEVRELPKVDGRTTLVRLFKGGNEERQWEWFAAAQIRRMGVDAELDMTLYRGEKNQQSEIQSIRLAYREAFRTKKIKHIINTKLVV